MQKLELSKWVLETLKESKGLIMEQAPEVLQQFVAVESIRLWSMLALGILLFAMGVGVFIAFYKYELNDLILVLGSAIAPLMILFGTHIAGVSGYRLFVLTYYTKAYILKTLL